MDSFIPLLGKKVDIIVELTNSNTYKLIGFEKVSDLKLNNLREIIKTNDYIYIEDII